MGLPLKDYQLRTLDALSTFFEAARGAHDEYSVAAAFNAARKNALGDAAPRVPYRPLSADMSEVPQVCIRIPTGGGKTLLASHAVERAARGYVGTQSPLVVWLVPSNTIRTQTLDALQTPGHPYREALLDHYPADRLSVLDIADCVQLRAQDFGGRTIVLVGTIQTLRVDNTASRNVYAYNEAFEPHFATLPDEPFFERIGERDIEAQPYLAGSLGKAKRSFANLLAWWRPIVIVDEAHNNRSPLSFEVLKRIRPACVIEMTATPADDQNLLYHVSAQELKAEHMVKLPIVLSPHPNWQEAVRDALLARERLAEAARSESDYVRPIVLLQADAVNGDVPVDKLKAHLLASGIEERRIAVATGSQRDLDGVNLFDPACPVDFVITVEALKEGWDCSFAYVFCTVQNIRSAKDMEQLLGRVLRLPYAKPRVAEALNRAYAHVCSPDTAEVANRLADRLVAMGFEELEAAQFIQVPLGGDFFAAGSGSGRPPPPPLTSTTMSVPAAVAEALKSAAPDAVTVTTDASGTRVTVTGVLPQLAVDAAEAAATKRDAEAVGHAIARHQARAHVAAAPSQRGETFAPIPQLCIPVQGELTLLDADALADLAPFSLAGAAADLPGFTIGEESNPYLIDVQRGKVVATLGEVQQGLDLGAAHEGIRREDIIREVDRRVRRDDTLQADMVAWLGRALDGVLAKGVELTQVARHVNAFADACARRIAVLWKSNRGAAFHRNLFSESARPSLSEHYRFAFDPAVYPARWSFGGRWTFAKHFYPLPGELDDDVRGEETACAITIDGMPEVRFWVRNLERQPVSSFWLPTSTDRFYPDFVLQLNDGRIAVIEYKGADRWSGDDSKEKRDIGSVWAAASGGNCRFAMVTSPDATRGVPVAEQIRRAIAW
mgnify:CR=1 FL=1